MEGIPYTETKEPNISQSPTTPQRSKKYKEKGKIKGITVKWSGGD
jgi:hypothetical protein